MLAAMPASAFNFPASFFSGAPSHLSPVLYDNYASGHNTGNTGTFNIVVTSAAARAAVCYTQEAGGTASAVTVGGISLTAGRATTGGGVSMESWYGVGIPSGTISIVTGYAIGPTVSAVQCATFSNVNQSTPLDSLGAANLTGTAASSSLSYTTVNNNSMIVSGLNTFSAGGTSAASGVLVKRGQDASNFENSIGAVNVAAAGANTVGWTFTSTTFIHNTFSLASQ